MVKHLLRLLKIDFQLVLAILWNTTSILCTESIVWDLLSFCIVLHCIIAHSSIAPIYCQSNSKNSYYCILISCLGSKQRWTRLGNIVFMSITQCLWRVGDWTSVENVRLNETVCEHLYSLVYKMSTGERFVNFIQGLGAQRCPVNFVSRHQSSLIVCANTLI